MKPFLSIIMPVYNGEKFLADSIESIILQPCNDWELILVNDGSKDNSLNICQRYTEKYENIVLLTHENHGTGYTRNRAISESRGDAIIFIDQDDYLLKGFYTEETRECIRAIFANSIDMIIPARLSANESMNQVHINKININGVMGGREASWKFKFEFFTNIYSRYLFEVCNVRFLQYKVDMESLFTHMAIYSSRKVLFSDNIYFSVRRENSQSVSHTWNYLKVLPIKLDAWVDVMNWHLQKDPADDKIYCDCVRKFLECMMQLIDGYCETTNDYEGIVSVLKNCKGYSKLEDYFKIIPEMRTKYEEFINDNYSYAKLVRKYGKKERMIRKFKNYAKLILQAHKRHSMLFWIEQLKIDMKEWSIDYDENRYNLPI